MATKQIKTDTKKITEVKRGRGRPARVFSAAQRRSIKNCKTKGWTAKQTAEKINTLKVTLNEKPVSVSQMIRALSVCDNW